MATKIHKKKKHVPELYLPEADEIQAACAAIRETWPAARLRQYAEPAVETVEVHSYSDIVASGRRLAKRPAA